MSGINLVLTGKWASHPGRVLAIWLEFHPRKAGTNCAAGLELGGRKELHYTGIPGASLHQECWLTQHWFSPTSRVMNFKIFFGNFLFWVVFFYYKFLAHELFGSWPLQLCKPWFLDLAIVTRWRRAQQAAMAWNAWNVGNCTLSWSLLSWPGLSWSVLSCPGLSWPVLACSGLFWPVLACPGLAWSCLS